MVYFTRYRLDSSDVHHLFPKDYLKKEGLNRGQYNQPANYTIAQSEINISIGNKEPSKYIAEMIEQCNGGKKKYGNIADMEILNINLKMNCVPDNMDKMSAADYQQFLSKRRILMAQKIKTFFNRL